MAKELYYWDSNAFSGYLNGETDKVPECEPVLIEARKGHIQIVTSALTLAEVLYIKGGPKLYPSKRETIDRFFRSDFIAVRDVTRFISNIARDVFWDHNIDTKDAVHVATAVFHKVPVLHTFDKPLINKSGLTIMEHTLKIERPHITHQPDMYGDSEDGEEQDKAAE